MSEGKESAVLCRKFFDNNTKHKGVQMKVHSRLNYEARMRDEYNKYVPILNKRIYNLKKYIGNCEDWKQIELYMSVSMHPPQLSFDRLTRYRMELVQSALRITKLDKSTSEYGVKFTAEMNDGTVTIFSYDLPNSCEIVKEVKWNPANRSEYKVDADGNVSIKREVVVGVNCGDKSMVDAIFGEAK